MKRSEIQFRIESGASDYRKSSGFSAYFASLS